MNEQVSWSLNRADSRTFSGEAHSTMLAAADLEAPVKLYFVRFGPGARTFWHTHSGPQILLIKSGRCRYQRAGGKIQEALAGESVRFEAGERHWHGGSPAEGTEHIAINLTAGETDWQEEVSEEDYLGSVETREHDGNATSSLLTSAPPS